MNSKFDGKMLCASFPLAVPPYIFGVAHAKIAPKYILGSLRILPKKTTGFFVFSENLQISGSFGNKESEI